MARKTKEKQIKNDEIVLGNKTKKRKKKSIIVLIKDEFKKIKDMFCDFLYGLKDSPKKTLISLLVSIIEIIKNNSLFFIYIITSLFISVTIRYFTINTLDNLLFLKPVLGDLTVILILGSFCFLFRGKWRFLYLFIISIFYTVICVANSIYYTFYTSYISVSLISSSRYAVQVGDAIFENVIKVRDFTYIIAPILLLIFYLKLNKKKNPMLRDVRKFIVSLFGGFIVMLMFLTSLTSLDLGRFSKQWNREYIVMNFGAYLYQLNDIVKSIEPKFIGLFDYDKSLKKFQEYYKDRPDNQEWSNEYTNIFKGKNLLVIHAESMQNLNLGLTFNGQEVTPNLNKLAKKSLYFSNFYSQVSQGTSSDTEFTFNTSLMPANVGIVFESYFNREYVATPLSLKNDGYYTFSMHANNGSFWNRNIMHETLGYKRFYSKVDYKIDETIGLGLSDKSFLKQSLEKIKKIYKENQPFMGTIITLTNHTPFSDTDMYGEFDVNMKETVINSETGKEEEVIYPYMEGTKLGNYFKSVHYADEQLGYFIDELEKEGILDNTVLVIYGDHDARLPKSDYRRLYNYDKEEDSYYSCDEDSINEHPDCKVINSNTYELLRKVPFIIYSKETEKKYHKEITDVMGMYDCMPTLGNMFGFYNKYALGHDIFDIKDDNIVVFPNGNWVTNDMYYNNQNETFITLSDKSLPKDYITKNNEYSEKLLDVSDKTIVFDLIKKTRKQQETKDYIEETTIKDE